jgi:hypothetical protein
MAAVKCTTCGAAVTVLLVGNEASVSHGADFRAKCKELGKSYAADFVTKATECAAMQNAVDRALTLLRSQR